MLEIALRQDLGAFSLELEARCPPGVTVVFGPSGAGKTSLARAVAGLSRGIEGRISLGGRLLLDRARGVDLPPHQRRIGYVFQEPRLFPHLSVAQNLTYGAARGTSPEAVARMLDIGPLLGRRPGALSGGEAQRVALGRALLSGPDLLILDEPLAALDQGLKSEILPYLARLRDESGVAMLYITHAIEEVLRLGTSLMILRAGRMARFGPVAQILADPEASQDLGPHLAGAVLAGRVGAEADGLSAIETPAGVIHVARVAFAAGAHVQIRILAQDVILARSRPKDLSALNILPARVVGLHPGAGPDVSVVLEAGGARLLARVTKRSAGLLALEAGQPVFALLKTVAVAAANVVPGQAPR